MNELLYILYKIRKMKELNLSLPLTEEEQHDSKINNYDTGMEETFDVVIEFIENRIEHIESNDLGETKWQLIFLTQIRRMRMKW